MPPPSTDVETSTSKIFNKFMQHLLWPKTCMKIPHKKAETIYKTQSPSRLHNFRIEISVNKKCIKVRDKVNNNPRCNSIFRKKKLAFFCTPFVDSPYHYDTAIIITFENPSKVTIEKLKYSGRDGKPPSSIYKWVWSRNILLCTHPCRELTVDLITFKIFLVFNLLEYNFELIFFLHYRGNF